MDTTTVAHLLAVKPQSLSLQQGSHSAEWWVYQDLVRPNPDSTSPAVRVSDPAQADVFFVPFMGSQAFLCADSAQYTLSDHAEVCGELKGKNHQLQVRKRVSGFFRSIC